MLFSTHFDIVIVGGGISGLFLAYKLCETNLNILLIEKGKSLGIRPRAKVLAAATVATDPNIMLTGPGPATKKALNKARMSIKDIDLMEVNEAFAVVVLRFLRDMELDRMDNDMAATLFKPVVDTVAVKPPRLPSDFIIL